MVLDYCIRRKSFSSVSVVKNLPAMSRCRRSRFHPWVGKIPWKRAWQPTPGFLPGESHGQRSLVGYSPQGHKESVTTEATEHARVILCLTLKKKQGRFFYSISFLYFNTQISIKILRRKLID